MLEPFFPFSSIAQGLLCPNVKLKQLVDRPGKVKDLTRCDSWDQSQIPQQACDKMAAKQNSLKVPLGHPLSDPPLLP